MKITPEMVDYISDLSRLRLPEEEKEAMAAELERIIGYMETLGALDAGGAEPGDRVLPGKSVLREDVVEESMDRQALLANAPASDGESLLVPRAVE